LESGFKLDHLISGADKEFLSCVALPTCVKALAESERVREFLINEINEKLIDLDLFQEPISLRIVGCPNGCVRPYVAEIAIVGRLPGVYSLYLGGHQKGNRLNKKFLDKVPLKEIPSVLAHLFSFFKKQRKEKESFGDFLGRNTYDRILNHLGPEIGNYGIVI
jgi:sulfite reductase beta subunit-like hemoprotein